MSQSGRAARGIGRSLRIYYGDAERTRRMDALNAALVPAGGLAFDVGAHVGDRVASFRRLGARVVAAEPQPAALRALRLIHGRDPGVTLVPAALGAAPGRMLLRLNTRNPTVTTGSAAFVAAARDAEGWRDERWDGEVEVDVTTLDALIAAHGVPDFVKIDVEGAEDAVLAGLSRALPALSFEMTMIRRDVAFRCLDRLEALGEYVFNLSLGETHALDWPDWLPPGEARAVLAALPDSANAGDVHARRVA